MSDTYDIYTNKGNLVRMFMPYTQAVTYAQQLADTFGLPYRLENRRTGEIEMIRPGVGNGVDCV